MIVNQLSKTVEIGLKYSNSFGEENLYLRDFVNDLKYLREIKESLKDIEELDILSSIEESLEKDLGLSQLFESAKASLPEILQERDLDRNYFDSIKSNNNERLEKILKFAAEKNDHKLAVYRGDDKPYNDYTDSLKGAWEKKSCGGAIGRGLYFASTKRYADLFGAKANYNGVTRKFFIKATPVDLEEPEVINFIKEYQAPLKNEVKRLDEEAKPHRKTRKSNEPPHQTILTYNEHIDKLQNQVLNAIKTKFGGDSICVKEYGLFAKDGEYEYNIQNPKHIKLADLIVLDDNGKIIPPSKRFDTKSSDIRGMTKDALLKLPLKEGLTYLAKDSYKEGNTFSSWKENLIANTIGLIKRPPIVNITNTAKHKPSKKIQEELVPIM